MTIHSLTAVRVIAEFLVVHYHLGGFWAEQSTEGDFYVEDIMSLFFVLSGFVAMYNNPVNVNAFSYWRKRIGKSYPTYVIWLLADLPGAYLTQFHCAGYEYLGVLQIIPISPWLGSTHILMINAVSWYMATLFWLWLMFPFLHTPVTLACRTVNPWIIILLVYCASLLACTLAAPLYYHHVRALPVLRVFEFIIGACSALTIDKGIHWLVPVVAFLGLVLIWIFTQTLHDPPITSICTLWPTRQTTWNITASTYFSRSAIVWVLVLHWLVHTERTRPESSVICALKFDLFRWLGTFSLQLYLGHLIVATGLYRIPQIWGNDTFWTKDYHMLACYLVCYAYSQTVQRMLDGWCVPSGEARSPEDSVTQVIVDGDMGLTQNASPNEG